MEDNLIFGAAMDGDDYSPGIHKVRIRRQSTEPYTDGTILIVRKATKEEYIKYHEDNGLGYNLSPSDRYFAFYMD